MASASLGKLASRALSVAGKCHHRQLRRLNIHEYQGAELMGKYGINVPRGAAAGSVLEVNPALKNVFPCEKELIIAYSMGGTSIEDLAEKYPDKIIKVPIDVSKGITDEDAAKVDGLALKAVNRQSSIEQIKKLYKLFCKCDCTLLEINPLAETVDKILFAADAKLNFDDNAAFRQKEIFALRDTIQEDPREINPLAETADSIPVASDAKLNFDGNAAFRQKEIFTLHDTTEEDPIEIVEASRILTLDDTVMAKVNPIRRGFKGRPAWCGPIGEDGLPTWVDWTLRGAVTPVQDQIISGPCWAFASIGAIEAANFLYTGKLVKLSEQQLIDCNNVNNDGIDRGLLYEAFQYVRKNGGVASAHEYPYVAKQRKCRQFTTELVTISGIGVVEPDCEKALKKAVSQRPIGVGIQYTNDIRFYNGDVLMGPNSRLYDLDHAVLLVGYGTLDGQKYWKIKDSEGEHKGPRGGFIYIARDVYEAGGTLGIARHCVYPTKKIPNRVGPVRSEVDMGIKPARVKSIEGFFHGLPTFD